MSNTNKAYDLRGIIGAAIFIVVGVLAIYYSGEFSPLGSVFPRTIAAAMILLSVVYIVTSLLWREAPETPAPSSNVRRILLAIVMLAWALLLEPLGFLSTSVLCYAAVLVIANYDRWTPRSALMYTAVGICILGGLYGTFRFALQVPFPAGILL
jgi:putative tricarboxylic transport membrane protein